MPLADVKALTFDVFGTVVDWRNSIAREAKALLEPKGFAHDWHFFAERWRARYQPAMERVRSGERPWVRLDELHRENLVELLAEFDVSGLSAAANVRKARLFIRFPPASRRPCLCSFQA